MSIFDPFNQAKLQNGLSKVRNATLSEKDMSLDDLKRLSGVDKVQSEATNQITNEQKHQFMRENNIRPGDQAWFKLWHAKPHLTGEDPFGKSK
jgi:hypothetical protein